MCFQLMIFLRVAARRGPPSDNRSWDEVWSREITKYSKIACRGHFPASQPRHSTEIFWILPTGEPYLTAQVCLYFLIPARNFLRLDQRATQSSKAACDRDMRSSWLHRGQWQKVKVDEIGADVLTFASWVTVPANQMAVTDHALWRLSCLVETNSCLLASIS